MQGAFLPVDLLAVFLVWAIVLNIMMIVPTGQLQYIADSRGGGRSLVMGEMSKTTGSYVQKGTVTSCFSLGNNKRPDSKE